MNARRLAALVLGALALMAGPVRADLGGFVIRSFDSDLTVRPDAGVAVVERIEVEFFEPRHGIYRTIPVRYTDGAGFAYSLGLRVESVTDGEGRKIPARVSNAGRYVKIRIGHPNRVVSGRVRYVLRYRLRDALGRFPEHDEIYWNATGNEWNTAIEQATATVHLPAALPADSLQAVAYVGRFGSREQGAAISVPEPGTVVFHGGRRLGSLEGLTIDVAWPRGYVRYPTAAQKTARFLGDNLILLAIPAAFGLLMVRYRRHGVDPPGPAAVMVRYEPPPGMTPGEIGTLVDERVDLRDITATIVDLAIRGYLVIRIEKRDTFLGLMDHDVTVFSRTKKPIEDLTPPEQLVLSGIFEKGDVVDSTDLREKFYVHIPGISRAVRRRLVETGYFSSDPSSVRNRYVGLGVAAAMAVAGAGLLWARHRGLVMPAGILPVAIAAAGTFLLFVLFAPAMPRRTTSGVRMRGWARGFEEFVDRVEREKLEQDRLRDVFESLLPYAMALGVAAKWARRFEGIYQAPPAWFTGGTPGSAFSTVMFEHSLASAMRSAGASMAASPRSSGSGGGGFSGGGGGGGGGGSW